jgi:quercetin dioxygenase-like cupin family protein
MATRHATPGETVDLSTWGEELPQVHSKTIMRNDQLELARIVLRGGERWEEHRVDGPIVIQCLSGRVRCSVRGEDRLLSGGQLMYLPGGVPHGLKAEVDASLLLTIVFG